MENSKRNDRQTLYFGEAGQQAIRAARVAIVGLGGLGSQVAQALGYLGVLSFLLVDDDRIEETNLNRVVGAYPSDIGTPKVEVAERMLRQINPEVEVASLFKNLRSQEALDALTNYPVIFGCLDHYGPRLILSELSAAYGATLIDTATDLDPEVRCEPGGRVIVAKAGEFCLDCAGQMNNEAAKQDLESSDVREVRLRHNYGLPEEGPAASVVSLNGIIANLAVTEFIVMITGIREPQKFLTYKFKQGRVTSRIDGRREDCFTCGYLAGKREGANVFRYAL